MTNAGGLGILCADACDAAGLELVALSEETRKQLAAVVPPEASLANPVDLLGSATAETYARALPAVVADEGVDAVIVLFVPAAEVDAADVAAAIEEAHAGVGEARCTRRARGRDASGILPVPRNRRAGAGSRGRAGRMASQACRDDPGRDRDRPRRGRRSGCSCARRGRRPVARCRPTCAQLLEAYGIPIVPERLADGPRRPPSRRPSSASPRS